MSTESHLFSGRYELQDRIGVGGMSTVRLALDTRLERYVAVKLLAEHLAQDGNFVSRFRREALSAARLVHPNIVQVFDFGLDDASGRHYIVMEYVAGQSMAEVLREQGRLEPDTAVPILDQSCRGLDYAHRHGVVHRDVKPANLLRSKDGQVKLADFGIAKAREQSDITKVGSVIGTAAYLAPEQARGEPAGPPADIYALGVVAYQLMAGRLPYDAPSLTELARQQEAGLPPALSELHPDVPASLSEAVDLALAPDPEDRYQDAMSFEQALSDGLRGVAPAGATESTRMLQSETDRTRALPPTAAQAAAPPPRRPLEPIPDDHRPPPPSAYPPPPPEPFPGTRKRRGRRFATWLLILLLLGGAGVGIWALLDQPRKIETREPVSGGVDRSIDELRKVIEDNAR